MLNHRLRYPIDVQFKRSADADVYRSVDVYFTCRAAVQYKSLLDVPQKVDSNGPWTFGLDALWTCVRPLEVRFVRPGDV